MSPKLDKSPAEAWFEYVKRLERERLRAQAEQLEMEAQALREVGGLRGQEELIVAANAKQAAAKEFRNALKGWGGQGRESQGRESQGRESQGRESQG